MVLTLAANSNDWQQVYFANLQDRNKLVVPVLLDSLIIALMLSAPIFTDPDKWGLGAYVQREIFTGLTVGGNSDARLNGAKKLYVNRLQVFTFNDVKTDYSLIVSPFVYGANVNLSVWEYIGEITP